MKKAFLSLIVAAAILQAGCSQTNNKAAVDSTKAAIITFNETEHDFGTIKQGSDATYIFEFKNTGKSELIVNNAQASCGCTIPQWTKDPVEKNKKGEVKVKYNTNNVGSFAKQVTVYSNSSNSPVVLKIKGIVIQADAAQTEQKK